MEQAAAVGDQILTNHQWQLVNWWVWVVTLRSKSSGLNSYDC